MTAQISDSFLFRGAVYSLIARKGGELFVPQQFGMEPEALHTACWRGFYCAYEITNDRLLLVQLTIREKSGRYQRIGGIAPEIGQSQATYKDLHVPVSYTGIIRLGKDFIEELYVHMGFQKATSFRTVIDLNFRAGRLIEFRDRSEEAARKRGAFKERFGKGNLSQDILDAFSLDMDIE